MEQLTHLSNRRLQVDENVVYDSCLRDSSKVDIESRVFSRSRQLRLLAKCLRRYDRRRHRCLLIRQSYCSYYHRWPGPGSRPWSFYDEWSGQRLKVSYDQALHLEEQALILYNRLTRLFAGDI